jgi:hypothetical protein
MERESAIAAWESFYVIVGSSAAALTGLQFVVITLIGADEQSPGDTAEVNAFGTPTVVHFCAVLLVAAILSAPWHTLTGVGEALAVCGVAGVAYMAIVIRRARRAMGYKPVLEDWIWHAIFPSLAYIALLVPALLLRRDPVPCLFVIAGASVLLLFIGIHNAWDTVIYVAVERRKGAAKKG